MHVLLLLFGCLFFTVAQAGPGCGGHSQRECTVFEQVPSCNPGLTAAGGSCYNCGAVGERACAVTVQMPSCDSGLNEMDGYCREVICGGQQQAPCPVSVRVPSCDAGLMELNGRCQECGNRGQAVCPVTVLASGCVGSRLVGYQGTCVPCGAEDQRQCPVTPPRDGCYDTVDGHLDPADGWCRSCGGNGEHTCKFAAQAAPCDEHLGQRDDICLPCERGGPVCRISDDETRCTGWAAPSGTGIDAVCEPCGHLGEPECPGNRMGWGEGGCLPGLINNGTCINPPAPAARQPSPRRSPGPMTRPR